MKLVSNWNKKNQVIQSGHIRNQIVACHWSKSTRSLRFDGELNVDMNEYQTSLVPFPCLHFMSCMIGPNPFRKKQEKQKTSKFRN